MDWKCADRVSDKIVDLINAEREREDFTPIQMFAGQLCAMLALLRTADGIPLPMAMIEIRVAIEKCLSTILAEHQSEPS
jgi:hypothetical protein